MPDNFDLERRVIRLEEWRLTVDKALFNGNGNGRSQFPVSVWQMVLLAILAAFLATGLVAILLRF